MVAIAVALRWKLMHHAWFWVTIAFLALLHLPLILLIPWTTEWIPALLIMPFATADLYVMLWTLSIVERCMDRPEHLDG
jgi:hypothetical protein